MPNPSVGRRSWPLANLALNDGRWGEWVYIYVWVGVADEGNLVARAFCAQARVIGGDVDLCNYAGGGETLVTRGRWKSGSI